jgi:formylglycine-generating enzyme required for sulfatase activity
MDVMRLLIRSIQASIQYSLFLLSTFIFVTAAQAEASADSINKDLVNTLKEHMVFIDGGRFMMGSDSSAALKREQPSHQVTLDDFYMGQTEVTQALFLEVMGWNNSFFNCQTCPVNNISWLNIMLFVERLNKATGQVFRLPTEAEWEYAARGGQHSKGYEFSGSNNIGDVAWYADNATREAHPVAQKKPNELGLYDMTGNLWEFCQDDISKVAYKQGERINPLVLKTDTPKQRSMKVIRGGGYEFEANESQVYRRDGATNNVRMPDIGFRLAMSKDTQ